jgi:hypothetical protein
VTVKMEVMVLLRSRVVRASRPGGGQRQARQSGREQRISHSLSSANVLGDRFPSPRTGSTSLVPRRRQWGLDLDDRQFGAVQWNVGLTVELDVWQPNAADLHHVGAGDGVRRVVIERRLGGNDVILVNAVAAYAQAPDELADTAAV